MEDTITVIVPVYKAEKYIGRCVDSVLKQTYADWHLILVDDGSPDDSGYICDKLSHSDNRISVIHKSNGGAGDARNAGLAHCSTPWVTFLDADDTLEPEYLENFNLPDYHNQQNVIIIQGYRRVTPDLMPLGEELTFENREYNGSNCIEEAFAQSAVFEYGQTVGKAYRTAEIVKAGLQFPINFHLSEDQHFFLTALLQIQKIATREGYLYNYIMEPDTNALSRRKYPSAMMYQRFRALDECCERLINERNITDKNVVGKVRYFSTTAGISLILRSMNHSEETRRQRVDILRKIQSNPRKIRRDFNPTSFPGKVIKILMLYLPSSILYYLTRIAFK